MKLFLVAFTYETNAVTQERVIDSISFGEEFEAFRRVKDIAYAIESQTGYRCVRLLGITPLHKLITYERETGSGIVTA